MLTAAIIRGNDLSWTKVKRVFGDSTSGKHTYGRYKRWGDLVTWWFGAYGDSEIIYWKSLTPAGELWLSLNLPPGAKILSVNLEVGGSWYDLPCEVPC